jgi:hypothetical protein
MQFDLPPAEAIGYFNAKKVVSKKVFNQLSKEAQQGSFSVSAKHATSEATGRRLPRTSDHVTCN